MAVDIRSCTRCKKFFNYNGSGLCPECIHYMDEVFTKVRDYLYDNPTADINTIAEDLEVDSELVLQLLKEGRLEMKNASGSGLKCERCGTVIGSGMLCNSCKAIAGEGLEKAKLEVSKLAAANEKSKLAEELKRAQDGNRSQFRTKRLFDD